MFVCLASQADDNSKRPHETVTPNFMKEIPNIPGKCNRPGNTPS